MQWQTKLPLIAILRGIKPDEALAHVGAVIDAGFDAVEIPLNSPQWEQSIPAIVDAYGDKALIGAGTVLKPEQVDALARMGCQLIVTPNIHSEVIRRAVGYGMTVCPGCATATEAFTALEAGAQALKIFPSSAFGPQYIKALKAVLPPDIAVFAVGGVTPENLAQWIDAGCAGAGLGSDSRGSAMKITKITTYRLPPRWMFLKIETDEGVVGWGEPVIEGRARTVEAAVHELSDYLIGQDPSRINDLWQVMYRAGFYRGGPILMSAIAGIDQALWDIKGKVLNAPVWQLMGGLVRDKIKAYSWVGGDRPADVIDGIKTLREIGFDTFKLNGCEELGLIDNSRAVDAAVNTVAQIREAFGNQIEFGLDFHGRVSAPMAKVLIKELEPYRPLFIEEPVLAEQAEYYPKLAAQTHIPLAAGERMFSRFDFKRVLEAGGISILQPDLSHAGGITECYKIAGMAEAYDVTLAPHCPLGPIALAACLHIDFVSYNAVLQEQSMGIHYNKGAELLDFVKNKEDFSMVGGFFKPLTKPGLGVEIDEAKVIEFSKNAPDWRNPLWRHEDNSVAEW